MSKENEYPSALRCLMLAGGRMQIVPAKIDLLNPEREGQASHLYFVWTFTEGALVDLDGAIKGQASSRLFGYFTDHANLYAMGRHDVALPRACFEGMKGDFLELMRLVVAAVETDIPEGAKWSYAFCLCDCLGAAVPVGTGFGFEKKTS